MRLLLSCEGFAKATTVDQIAGFFSRHGCRFIFNSIAHPLHRPFCFVNADVEQEMLLRKVCATEQFEVSERGEHKRFRVKVSLVKVARKVVTIQ